MHVASDDVSRIEHVVFDGVSVVQVSGRRPVVNDVTLQRSQRGLVYFGTERNANEDTVCTDITVTDVRKALFSRTVHVHVLRKYFFVIFDDDHMC